MLLQLFGDQTPWQAFALGLGLAFLAAWILAHLAARLTRLVISRASGLEEGADIDAPALRRPVRIVWTTVFLIVFVLMIFPTLELAGFEPTVGVPLEVMAAWLIGSGTRVALIAILAYAIVRAVALAVRRFEDRMSQATGPEALELAKRARTLGRLLQNAVATVVVGIATLMILQQLRIDIMPVLTGAGIVGLAVGFGAQTLVRDIIAGFFLLLENQVRVGDVAIVNGTGGLVEAIRLRTIVLRDLHGTVHIFPNGGIDRLSNMSKDFSYFVLDVGVAYKEDTDRVADVLRQVGAGMQDDPAFGPGILTPLEILGVDGFGDSQVTIRVRFKTLPLQQWAVGRELRRRVKKAFDAAGIEIPFPHRSIYFGEASRPWLVQRAAALQPEADAR